MVRRINLSLNASIIRQNKGKYETLEGTIFRKLHHPHAIILKPIENRIESRI